MLNTLLRDSKLAELPVLDCLPELGEHLARGVKLLGLVAPPGSGKTILAPIWLQETLKLARVWVLVPKRLNARLPYQFLRPYLGNAVGYQIRFESAWEEDYLKVGYLTYGTALHVFSKAKPGAQELVIFDEFHERAWQADLLLAFLKSASKQKPKLLLMSATLDLKDLASDIPVVKSSGKLYPVKVSWETTQPETARRPKKLIELISTRSKELARSNPGQQLIFLPGMSFIAKALEALSQDGLGGTIDILHSSLAEKEIRRVTEDKAIDKTRRILATDLAESSVTIPGICTVIDSGLQRIPHQDPFHLGITLETIRAPLASLEQRRGRAGRLRAGHCHRLFTRQDELSREAYKRPEIESADPKLLALHLASLGKLQQWQLLEWLQAPETQALESACGWLSKHGLIENYQLSARGKKALSTTCSPRSALFALLANEHGLPKQQILDWTYALETGGSRQTIEKPRSLSELLEDKAWMQARDKRLLNRLASIFKANPNPKASGNPLVEAFSDTLIELKPGRALCGQKKAQALNYQGQETGYALLLASRPSGREGGKSEVTLYHPITAEAVWESFFEELEETELLSWDQSSKSVRLLSEVRLGSIVLEAKETTPAPGAKTAAILAANLTSDDYGEEFMGFARRWELFLSHKPEIVKELQHLYNLNTPPDGKWLKESYLNTVTSWREASKLEIVGHCKITLGYHYLAQLEEALPSNLNLPHRRRPLDVTYPQQGAPFVASKLQDFFGWTPPQLLGGKLKLACHLLAPSGRPVQITDDLNGFWSGSYRQVRKDLRGRYPKHDWPENP